MYTDLPRLLNMTLTGSFIILFVLLARLLLGKAPKIYSYALWAVVLFRLLCPVSFSAPVSLLGALDAPAATQGHTVEYISPTIVHDPSPAIDVPVTTLDSAINDSLPQGLEQTVADPLEFPAAAATAVWLFGMGALAVYSLISLAFLRRKLVGAVLLHGNVYLADHIESPFVMGLFRPKIYLPSALSEAEQGYILLHEFHHIRRLDHVWKLLGFLALCIHWFNPLVWLSFVLASKDMEMSCDEAVLKKMGTDIRADYSASLLSLATGRRIIAGAPLAFGEGDTGSRIKNALKWREPPAWVRALGALCCGIVVVLCAANPEQENKPAPEPFGHVYRVAEVVWGYPTISSTFDPPAITQCTLTSDYALNVLEGSTWVYPGFFQETEVTEENFDALFGLLPVSGEEYRRDNKNAWKCVVSDAPATGLYYLLEQKDGTILLAQGSTAGRENSSHPQDWLQWVYRLERADYVTCKVENKNSTTDLGTLGWYPEGFDFDYDSLPSATVYGSATLSFTVEDRPESLTVEEHYYARTSGDSVMIEKNLHTLTPDENGKFRLFVERRNNYDEDAIYYVAHDEGRYVIRIDFPFQADTTNVTTEEVESLFAAENPEAAILDSVVAYDGAYGTLGVVLYQEDDWSQKLGYVREGGWCQPVGIGSVNEPITAVEDSQLTYMGNGTVTWLCQLNGERLRYRMEYGIKGTLSNFRVTSSPAASEVSTGYYVTGQCLYLTPLSSTVYPDGDDGKLYAIGPDYFDVSPALTSSSTDHYSADWAWDDDPFALGVTDPIPLLQGENVRWQGMDANLALAQVGGELLLVNIHTSRNSGPYIWSVFTLVPDTEYIPVTPLESAVTEAVREAFFRNNTMNAYGCASHIILDTRELMYDAAIGSTPAGGKLTVVDLLALGMDFHMVEGTLTPIREKAMEMTLTFEEQNGAYILTGKESTILPDPGDHGLMLCQGCYSQAASYFGVDTEAVIEKLFDALASSPAASSSPVDYIQAHGWEYMELQFYGDHTLKFIFERFLAGGETGLRGRLMRVLLDELAPESALRLQAATGQEYFDQWLQSAKTTEEDIGIARMEREFPAAWLALRLADQ